MDIIKKTKKSNTQHPIRHTATAWDGTYQSPNIQMPQESPEDDVEEFVQEDYSFEPEDELFDDNDEQGFNTKKFFWISLVVFIISILISGWLLLSKADSTIEIMSDSTTKHSIVKTVVSLANSQSYKTLNGFEDGRINILLLGRANTHKSGKNLTDTIMIASIDTNTYKLSLLSLPRDLLVANGSFYTKINALYQIGLRNDKGAKYIIETVEDVTGQDIHYYFVLDFEGFIKIIDILGGINIDVPRHIKDERYPGPGYSYETFEVWPGLQEFDGEKALKYARTRHDDIEGDFGRAKRQQQVMQAARNKAFSLGTIVNPIKISELLTVLGEHVHTNIEPEEIEPFISLIKKVDTQNITNVVVDAWKPGSLLISARHYNEHGGISGLVPRIGNYKEIRDRAENIFDLNKIAKRQEEISKESPTITIVNATKNNNLIANTQKALYALGFKNIQTGKKTSNAEKTIIIDTTSGTKPFSLDELIKKLPAQKSDQTSSEYDSDFIIILGDDILDSYSYTEISQEELEDENAKNNDK
jgi:LCP family protein required for cell wall assembly